MDEVPADPPPSSRVISWFPELFQLGQRRIRARVRILGLAILVGVVAVQVKRL